MFKLIKENIARNWKFYTKLLLTLLFLYLLVLISIANLESIPFVSYCNELINRIDFQSIEFKLLLALIAIWLITNTYKLIHARYFISTKHYLVFLSGLLLYLLVRLTTSILSSDKLTLFSINDLRISALDLSVLLISVALLCVAIIGNILRKNERNKRNLSIKDKKCFNTDFPINRIEDDKYDYSLIADYIVERVINLPDTEGSFSLAICGPWGIGKTSLLRLLEAKLESKDIADNHKFIALSVSPLLVNESTTLTTEILNQLGAKLSKFLFRGKTHFKKYSYFLTGKVNDIYSALISIFIGDKSSQDKLNEIRELIKSIDRKILILIDDLDRLEKEEIVEVLRLMRNLGDLPNTIYIVAMDKDYLIQKLNQSDIQKSNSSYRFNFDSDNIKNSETKKTPFTHEVVNNNSSFSSAESYLEKFFTAEITLPVIDIRVLREDVLGVIRDKLPHFLKPFKNVYGITDISHNLDSPQQISIHYIKLAELCIQTKRDLIRLVNSLLLIPPQRVDEADIDTTKLLVLELLKLKFYNIYIAIQGKEVLYTEVSYNALKVEENLLSHIIEQHNPQRKDLLSKAIMTLFDEWHEGKPNLISIANPDRFSLYFNFFMKDYLSITNLNKLRKS